MNRNVLSFLVLCVLSTTMGAFLGCEDTLEYPNTAPQDLEINCEKCYVATTGTVALSGYAVDADEDDITYRWTATAGSFDPTPAVGASVTWIAPESPGTAVITLTVTDGIDSRSATQTIIACEQLPGAYLTSTSISNEGYPYITETDRTFIVPGHVTVTIEPGVMIIMDGALSGIEVFGRLIAAGTPSQKISLRGNSCTSETGIWSGVLLEGLDAEGELRNCDIAGSTDGITASDSAKLDMKDCSVYSSENFGISVMDGAAATLRSCFVWDNGNGIFIDDAIADIRRSSIRYSEDDGIICSASTDATMFVSIESCIVANNHKNGFVLAFMAAPAIHYCSIYSNQEAGYGTYAIKLEANGAPQPISAENNFWGLGMDTEDEIAAIIWDATDSPEAIFATVSFDPWLVEAPALSPPTPKGASGLPWAR